MIVPMKKVCLVVQNKSREDALLKLRDIGVVYIDVSGADPEKFAEKIEYKARLEDAIGVIQPLKEPKKKKKAPEEEAGGRERRLDKGPRRGRRVSDKMGIEELEPYSLDAVNAPERPSLVNLMNEMGRNRKAIEEELPVLVRERDRIAPWGDFDPAQFRELNSFGRPGYLYELIPSDFEALAGQISYIKISEDKATVRILVLDAEIPGMTPFPLPKASLSAINAEIASLEARLKALDDKIKSFADRHQSLIKEMDTVQADIEFSSVLAELEQVEGVPSVLGISYFSGYLPAEETDNLKKAAAENGWALSFDDPSPSDKPPTLLRNKPAVRIIQPLLTFLGTIPGYREFDISPSYLIFFSLFFAMIFGDAGYGVLILAASLYLGMKQKKKTGRLPDLIILLMVLATCTIIWGSINGAWFSIPAEKLPLFLRALIIKPFDNMGPLMEFPPVLREIFKLPAQVPMNEFKTRWCMQFFCFTVAAIQLIWARGKRIAHVLPSLLAFEQAGWLLLMLGLYFVVLAMLLSIALPPFIPWVLGAGAGLVIVFCEQKGGNFFKNIGKGLSGLFTTFLKAVSCFADIISYIRLFAVGLAGALIGQIFNSLAIPSGGLGSFGVNFIVKLIMAVLILGIGHGLNLALTALSVIVHGVRLNLLEYAGNHLDMEWSGYEYKPFALKQMKKQ